MENNINKELLQYKDQCETHQFIRSFLLKGCYTSIHVPSVVLYAGMSKGLFAGITGNLFNIWIGFFCEYLYMYMFCCISWFLVHEMHRSIVEKNKAKFCFSFLKQTKNMMMCILIHVLLGDFRLI